ncbi:hypothetical protein [Nocardioides taihuensis]|jgi:hypothetical protein|uniref:Heavy-metal-associated domain-containing protein n=1 Tax=Nocardioides taihuensis TaxID=1835606 RepID=A0ABW0BDR8_9ACTN
MKSTTRTAGFVLSLVAVTGAAALIGAAVGPVGADTQPQPHRGGHESAGDVVAPTAGHGDGHDESHGAAGTALPGGLMVSQDGYTLQLLQDHFQPARRVPLRFRITDPSGATVTAYEVSHGKQLHLIAVRRDLSDFQHVHPELDEDGTWSVPVDLAAPGEYRVFADFTPQGAGEGYTLGHDVSVAGDYSPQTLPEPARTATVDGYEVELEGTLVPGRTSRLTLTVTKDGEDVTDLQPYLGAYGHLVALRDGDLAYLHVHPDGEPGDGRTEPGPVITFHAEVPSVGSYRLFLDFQHRGVVRTAAFTATASDPGDEQETGGDPHAGDHAH